MHKFYSEKKYPTMDSLQTAVKEKGIVSGERHNHASYSQSYSLFASYSTFLASCSIFLYGYNYYLCAFPGELSEIINSAFLAVLGTVEPRLMSLSKAVSLLMAVSTLIAVSTQGSEKFANAHSTLIHSLNGHSLLRITAITTSGSGARGEPGTGDTCPPLAGTFLVLRSA